MGRRLYTESCVRELPSGSELVLGRDAIATPSALELAFERGIRVRYGDGSSTPGASPAASSSGDGGLARLLREDGEYVVKVEKGRARVFRLAASGPVFVGEGS